METKEISQKKNVLIVDEQPVCYEGLRRILSRSREFRIVGHARSIAETAGYAHEADIAVMDISASKNQGVAAIRDLRQQLAGVPLLILTSHDELLFAERCLKCGARGYLMKTASHNEILTALNAVAHGNLHISDRVRSHMLKRLNGQSDSNYFDLDRLSDRELLIVQHISQSKNNKEIADELKISVKTIESHRSRIKSKLKLSSASDLVRLAIKLQRASV